MLGAAGAHDGHHQVHHRILLRRQAGDPGPLRPGLSGQSAGLFDQAQQLLAMTLQGAPFQATDLPQCGQVPGDAAGDVDDHLVLQHPAARPVDAPRLRLPPLGQRLGNGQLAPLELLVAAHPLPQTLHRRGVGGGVHQGIEVGLHPVLAALFPQAAALFAVDVQQIAHVVGGIAQLPFAQRAAAPVGAGVALLQHHAGKFAHQAGVADLVTVAEQGGGDLGVEHRAGQVAAQVEKDLQILPRGVHHQGHGGVVEDVQQRVDVLQRQRIDAGDQFVAGDLDQTELGVIGLFAQEFGIQRQRLAAAQAVAEGGQRLGGIDENFFHGVSCDFSGPAMMRLMPASDEPVNITPPPPKTYR